MAPPPTRVGHRAPQVGQQLGPLDVLLQVAGHRRERTRTLALLGDQKGNGDPGQPNGRLGTKKDAEDQLALLQEASAEMKKLGQEGKCWDTAEKEFKLPKYASWPGYDNGLPFIARRYCGLWGRGT